MKNKWKQLLVVLILLGFGITVGYFIKEEKKSAARTLFAMDTYMEITAYGRNSEAAVEASAEEIRRLEALLSTGDETSEIAMLNRDKKGELSKDSVYLLKRSMELWEATGGTFDITIYPVMEAWGFAGKNFRVPTQGELDDLLTYVDASKIQFEEETNMVILPEQVKIDFGGIAKGYTSARIAQIMEDYHIESAKINLGGNVQTVGTKADGSAWRIAIKSPDDTLPYLGIISVEDKAVITSGGYERYFEEKDVVYHHIINPKTGKPAQSGLVSVTIVCEDGTLGDGLSTALYVLGKDEAIAFWREHSEEFDAVLLDDAGMLYVTEGLKDSFTAETEYEIVYRK